MWLINSAIIIAFGYLQTNKEILQHDRLLIPLTSSLGLICSFSWILINIGSKHWQNIWNKEAKAASYNLLNYLVPQNIESNSLTFIFRDGHRSVTSIITAVSTFFTLLWTFIIIHHTFGRISSPMNHIQVDLTSFTLGTISYYFCWIISYYSKEIDHHKHKCIHHYAFLGIVLLFLIVFLRILFMLEVTYSTHSSYYTNFPCESFGFIICFIYIAPPLAYWQLSRYRMTSPSSPPPT